MITHHVNLTKHLHFIKWKIIYFIRQRCQLIIRKISEKKVCKHESQQALYTFSQVQSHFAKKMNTTSTQHWLRYTLAVDIRGGRYSPKFSTNQRRALARARQRRNTPRETPPENAENYFNHANVLKRNYTSQSINSVCKCHPNGKV